LERFEPWKIKIVLPSAVEVLDPRPEPTVTLVTCYPFYSVGKAPKRYVVHAALARLDAHETHPAQESRHEKK
jgi:sortase A